jgi:hypothetical protein
MAFDIDDLRAILRPCRLKKYHDTSERKYREIDKYEGHEAGEYEDLKINEDGVWPRVRLEVDEPSDADEEDLLFEQWRPVQELDDDSDIPGQPPRKSAAKTPSLPFPFSASELAAFMLYGYGAGVQGHYGHCGWDTGPDPTRLNGIPSRKKDARRAVQEAFDAYREAVKVVGPRPMGFYAETPPERKKRKEAYGDANESERAAMDAAMDDAIKAIAATYPAAEAVWLKAMVRQLLLPAPQLLVPLPAPVLAQESKEQRQDRRLKACEAAGLVMPKNHLSRLPYGVGDVADKEGVTRQAFSSDIKAALTRRESAIKEGTQVHRA